MLKNKSTAEFVKLIVVLFLITAITALALAFVNEITKDKIKALGEEKLNAALNQVLAADTYEALDLSGVTVDPIVSTIYAAKSGDQLKGYCVRVLPNGFGGAIETIVGIDPDGKVIRVSIVSMTETAGIGTKTQEDSFLDQFAGKSGELTVSKALELGENEISAITGATVSSKAVTHGVTAAIAAVNQLKGGMGNA